MNYEQKYYYYSKHMFIYLHYNRLPASEKRVDNITGILS